MAPPDMKFAYRVIGPRLYIHYRAWRAWRKARDGHEGELRLLSAVVPRDRIALDIGANRGTYTYFLSRLAQHTTAYEPAPAMAAFIRMAKLPRVEVREVGASDTKGSQTYFARFNVHDKPQYNVGHLAGAADTDAQGVRFAVETIRLDDENLSNVGFMKIDVEGHEHAVIEGARQMLLRDKPNLIVEILDGRGDRAAVMRNKTVHLLDSLGYDAFVFARGAVGPLRDASLSRETINYVFLPRSSAAAGAAESRVGDV
jgi:FkbM family methyltransferase